MLDDQFLFQEGFLFFKFLRFVVQMQVLFSQLIVLAFQVFKALLEKVSLGKLAHRELLN